jgi:cytochrome c5
MILLMLMSALAFAEESQDRSETLYKVFCVNCHGESVEKVPLSPESTLEQRVKIVNDGTEGMPPYSWMLSEGEAERLVKLMEEK